MIIKNVKEVYDYYDSHKEELDTREKIIKYLDSIDFIFPKDMEEQELIFTPGIRAKTQKLSKEEVDFQTGVSYKVLQPYQRIIVFNDVSEDEYDMLGNKNIIYTIIKHRYAIDDKVFNEKSAVVLPTPQTMNAFDNLIDFFPNIIAFGDYIQGMWKEEFSDKLLSAALQLGYDTLLGESILGEVV